MGAGPSPSRPRALARRPPSPQPAPLRPSWAHNFGRRAQALPPYAPPHPHPSPPRLPLPSALARVLASFQQSELSKPRAPPAAHRVARAQAGLLRIEVIAVVLYTGPMVPRPAPPAPRPFQLVWRGRFGREGGRAHADSDTAQLTVAVGNPLHIFPVPARDCSSTMSSCVLQAASCWGIMIGLGILSGL